MNTYETCTFYGDQDTAAQTELKTILEAASIVPGLEHNLGTAVSALSTFVADQIAGPSAIMARYIDDFAQAWVVCLVMGFIAPFLLSFVWMGVLRYFTGLFAYLIILMTNVGAIGITLYLYMKAGIIGGDEISAYAGDSAADSATNYVDPSEENQEVLGYCAHFSAVLAVLLLIFTLIMLKRVAIAVAVIKVATQAITAAPSVVFFPIAPVLLAFGFGAYWLAAAVYIYSSGENVLRSCDLSDASLAPKKYCASPNDPLNCHCGYETEMDENMQVRIGAFPNPHTVYRPSVTTLVIKRKSTTYVHHNHDCLPIQYTHTQDSRLTLFGYFSFPITVHAYVSPVRFALDHAVPAGDYVPHVSLRVRHVLLRRRQLRQLPVRVAQHPRAAVVPEDDLVPQRVCGVRVVPRSAAAVHPHRRRVHGAPDEKSGERQHRGEVRRLRDSVLLVVPPENHRVDQPEHVHHDCD